jgi:hypothetical protein
LFNSSIRDKEDTGSIFSSSWNNFDRRCRSLPYELTCFWSIWKRHKKRNLTGF